MNQNLSIVFSLFLLVGIIGPAYAQTISDNVVINEVDTNPIGDDSVSPTEWVELYNPTDSDVDLSGWKIASTTVPKQTMTIPNGMVIKPGQFLTYSYQIVWFTDANESVELLDENGIVIDKTPLLTDIHNDFQSWQRLYDGYNLDSSDGWKFATSTTGSSNGKLIETKDLQGISVTVLSEKSSYLFGETAVLHGSVSEEVEIVKPYFQPEQIIVNIDGPNFYKTITLYPDLNLNYKTTLPLHQVLGINEGTYNVSVRYDDATADTNFLVGFELIEQEEKVGGSLSILTDSPQYLPGQKVLISGFASEIVPFKGMKFSVTNSRGEEISTGNLFPTNGKFTTTIFVPTIYPDYGTYEINAEYSGESISTTFEIVEDFKENIPISLWIDKEAYGLGDEVVITGRLNQVWISTLDLEIIQTKQLSIGSSSSDTGFKILDGLQVMGDGSFTYTFTIPDNPLRLGDYRINVSKDIGSASVIAHAVIDPENFVVSSDPLTINSDKEVYDIGDVMFISGFIQNPFSNSSYDTGSSIQISISREDGTPLEIINLQQGEQTSASGTVVAAYDFTAIPETSGTYSTQIDLTANIFHEGNYTVKAQYTGNTVTSSFTIINPLDLKDGALVSLDKEVYGLGETVLVSGIIPPSGEPSLQISVTKPDGTVLNSGTSIDNQRFSWSWVTPITEQYQNIKTDDGRDVTKSNFGIYKIKISSSTYNDDLFFKVSADPKNDSLSTVPLFVSTEKSLYRAGETLKVLGNVIKREQGDEGLVVPERVQIEVVDGTFPFKKIHESFVYPNQGGEFSSTFELPITIFSEGSYTVKTLYDNTRSEITFSVANDFVFGIADPVSLLLSTDKSEYHLGDTVIINGKPNKLIYIETFDVGVIQKTDTEITCGSFICGINTGSITSILPSSSGSFTHEFIIPNSTSAVGSYEVTVDADFETKSIEFNVVEKHSNLKLDNVIEKENRISEKTISISVEEKTTDVGTIAPRIISGSLITPSRADESTVNLKVSTATGMCIIGPDADCLVSESTRKQGQIYDVVEVDGISLNIQYSGPDVRLEKFSILPKLSAIFLPDANWNVEVIKDDQVSRFYYKVTYKTLE